MNSNRPNTGRISLARTTAALLLLLAPIGLQADEASPGPAQLSLDDLRTFTDVFNQIRDNYVEEVDDQQLLSAAIDGMLAALDPHSAYLPDSDYDDLNDTSRGRYSGVGIDVDDERGRLRVARVIAPSPADDAGIEPGDYILSVDGRPIRGRPLQESIDALAGEAGTSIALSLQRESGDRYEVELVRDYITVPTLSFNLLDRYYGYFAITYFHRESAVQFEQALKGLAADGIELRGLILDLRDNPGGVLRPAVDIADGFLDSGVIVSTRARNPDMALEFNAVEGDWLPGVPIAVIVDRGTASASEVLAGALQDHQRAVIVGERTFGKGSVQSVLTLRNGSGLKLTTARYFTPSGRSIQAEGIEPDIRAGYMAHLEVEDRRGREADLAGHLEVLPDIQSEIADAEGIFDSVDAEDDFPLFQALNVVKGAALLRSSQ